MHEVKATLYSNFLLELHLAWFFTEGIFFLAMWSFVPKIPYYSPSCIKVELTDIAEVKRIMKYKRINI